MGRQRNRPPMKEQGNSTEEELNKMEVRNLSDIEFKVIITRMFNSIKRHRNHKKRPERNKECNI